MQKINVAITQQQAVTKLTGRLASDPPIVLSIAGSDSSGGAGMQADLNTFSAHGIYSVTVITAITAQNTKAVHAIHPLPAAWVQEQLDAVFTEFPIAAVKIGMLGTAEIVQTVITALRQNQARNIVLDPVFQATQGGDLLNHDAIDVMRRELIPLTQVLTPNLPEASQLLGYRIPSSIKAQRAAQALLALGANAILLKGGHATGAMVRDVYQDGQRSVVFRHRRLAIEAHGTGCTLAAAIAAGLAHGKDPLSACRNASNYLNQALRTAFHTDKGSMHLLRWRTARTED